LALNQTPEEFGGVENYRCFSIYEESKK